MTPEQKKFIAEAILKACEIVDKPHIGEDVKSALRDLVKISENVQDLSDQSLGQSADVRVVRKKLDQVKTEARVLEEKIATTKKAFISMATELEMISFETGQIVKRQAAQPASPDATHLSRIQASTKRMIEMLTQLAR